MSVSTHSNSVPTRHSVYWNAAGRSTDAHPQNNIPIAIPCSFKSCLLRQTGPAQTHVTTKTQHASWHAGAAAENLQLSPSKIGKPIDFIKKVKRAANQAALLWFRHKGGVIMLPPQWTSAAGSLPPAEALRPGNPPVRAHTKRLVLHHAPATHGRVRHHVRLHMLTCGAQPQGKNARCNTPGRR